MESLGKHSPSSLDPASATRPPSRDGKANPEGSMNGRAVQPGDSLAARTSRADSLEPPPVQGPRVKEMTVRVPSDSKAESKASLGAAEMLKTVRGAAVGMAMQVREKMGPLPMLEPVPSESASVSSTGERRRLTHIVWDAADLSPDDPKDSGKYLLAAATSLDPAGVAQVCFAAVDAAIGQSGKHEQVLKGLLGQLDQAASEAGAPVFIESKKSQLKLARIALNCRAGKHMGVDSRAAARDAAIAGTSLDKHVPGIYGDREEGFRYAAGDYRTALKLGGLNPAERVNRMLLVAMNRHESLRSACADVMAQILVFDEAGEAFQADVMKAALDMIESLKGGPARK